MSAQEILAEISKLSPEERQEVMASFDVPKKPAAIRLAELIDSEGIPQENLSELLLRFAGTMDGLPEDMAVNHDHYLYGLPKQKP